jgi:hypothetical protein
MMKNNFYYATTKPKSNGEKNERKKNKVVVK